MYFSLSKPTHQGVSSPKVLLKGYMKILSFWWNYMKLAEIYLLDQPPRGISGNDEFSCKMHSKSPIKLVFFPKSMKNATLKWSWKWCARFMKIWSLKWWWCWIMLDSSEIWPKGWKVWFRCESCLCLSKVRSFYTSLRIEYIASKYE